MESNANADCMSLYPCAAVVIVSDLLILPSYPIRTTEHLIRIVWRDKAVDEEIVLQLRKSDSGPFLGQLEKATGKPWKNLGEEWLKVQEQIKREEPNKIEIHLDRKVRIANSELAQGAYQIVLLEKGASRYEAYFFQGMEVDTDRLAAIAAVKVAPSTSETSEPVVVYKQEDHGLSGISAIRTTAKELRFP